jgi:hypothetical protein
MRKKTQFNQYFFFLLSILYMQINYGPIKVGSSKDLLAVVTRLCFLPAAERPNSFCQNSTLTQITRWPAVQSSEPMDCHRGALKHDPSASRSTQAELLAILLK